MATGLAKLACCQPEAVSPVKVTVPRLWPVLDHRLPTCVPVLVAALWKRSPVMAPVASDWNLTPSSTALGSPPSTMAGVGLDGQIIVVAGLTVMPSALVTLWLPAVTLMVKLAVPVVVGMPAITPVAAVRVSPAGSAPLAIDQGEGGGPPVARRGAGEAAPTRAPGRG